VNIVNFFDCSKWETKHSESKTKGRYAVRLDLPAPKKRNVQSTPFITHFPQKKKEAETNLQMKKSFRF
jgi:hypothetical protein